MLMIGTWNTLGVFGAQRGERNGYPFAFGPAVMTFNAWHAVMGDGGKLDAHARIPILLENLISLPVYLVQSIALL